MEKAQYGPRGLKITGSPEWCWQTMYLLQRYLFSVERSWADVEEMVEELVGARAWMFIPPEKPYGSFEAMCRDLLGDDRANDIIERLRKRKKPIE